MRGGDERSGSLFSYVDLEARVEKGHPLWGDPIDRERGAFGSFRRVHGAVLADGDGPSIPPEKLLRAMLLQATTQ